MVGPLLLITLLLVVVTVVASAALWLVPALTTPDLIELVVMDLTGIDELI